MNDGLSSTSEANENNDNGDAPGWFMELIQNQNNDAQTDNNFQDNSSTIAVSEQENPPEWFMQAVNNTDGQSEMQDNPMEIIMNMRENNDNTSEMNNIINPLSDNDNNDNSTNMPEWFKEAIDTQSKKSVDTNTEIAESPKR